MKITSREKIMLLALILVVVTWVSYVYIIEPQMKRISDLDLELRLKQTELHELEDLIKNEPKIDDAIKTIMLKFKKLLWNTSILPYKKK